MHILGINAYHADSAACLVRDGALVAAAEEERFRRIKHWAGFPSEAIRYCLAEAGITAGDVDHVAINRDPKANLLRKVLFSFGRRPSLQLVTDRLKNAARVRNVREMLAAEFGEIGAEVHNVEHHRAHLASAFLVSPFERAAVVSVDGFGDFVSAMWGVGRGPEIEILGKVHFPHSLGLFYQAITQHLGFWNYGDEYKVMGLAPYGEPSEMAKMRQIVRLLDGGGFELNLECFRHHAEGIEMVWDGGEPKIGQVFSNAMIELLGPPRACSHDIARQISNTRVVGNPYDDEVFYEKRIPRLRDVIFAGRLVSTKGCDLLVRALSCSRARGVYYDVTIVGDGPDRLDLEALCMELEVKDAVRFLGALRPADVALAFNEHRVSVVPSRVMEAFGIVALESLACGCTPVVSDVGGLPESIGRHGVIFPKEDVRALAEAIESLLGDEERRQSFLTGVEAHLERHRKATVARRYREVFAAVAAERRS